MLHAVGGEAEDAGYFFVGEPLGEKFQNLELAGRERGFFRVLLDPFRQ